MNACSSQRSLEILKRRRCNNPSRIILLMIAKNWLEKIEPKTALIEFLKLRPVPTDGSPPENHTDPTAKKPNRKRIKERTVTVSAIENVAVWQGMQIMLLAGSTIATAPMEFPFV